MSLLEAFFCDYIFLVVLVIYIRNYILLICAFPNIMFFEVIVKTILTKWIWKNNKSLTFVNTTSFLLQPKKTQHIHSSLLILKY